MSQYDEPEGILPSFCGRNACPVITPQANGTIKLGSTVSGGFIMYTQQEFSDLVTAVRNGEYDHLTV